MKRVTIACIRLLAAVISPNCQAASSAAEEGGCGPTELRVRRSSYSRLAVRAADAQEAKVCRGDAVRGQLVPLARFRSGAAVTFPLTSRLSLETDVALRRAEGSILALGSSTSLLFALPRLGQATPYAAGGIGLSLHGAPGIFRQWSPDWHGAASGADDERWRRGEHAVERHAGHANRRPVVQVFRA